MVSARDVPPIRDRGGRGGALTRRTVAAWWLLSASACEQEDDTAPVVQILWPAHGAGFALGEQVDLLVLATDADEPDASALVLDWLGLPPGKEAPRRPTAEGQAYVTVASAFPLTVDLTVAVTDPEGASDSAAVTFGFLKGSTPPAPTDEDYDGYTSDVDCDDRNPFVNPTGVEVCNGLDDNCSGAIDEGLTSYWYPDNDRDGWGNDSVYVIGCDLAPEYATQGWDCDDDDPGVNPTAHDICDGIDVDCGGYLYGPGPLYHFQQYLDADHDGFGNEYEREDDCDDVNDTYVYWNPYCPFCEDDPPFDCDDSNPGVNPSADELCGNGIDDDCEAGDAVCFQ
jgi:hypothetical protein